MARSRTAPAPAAVDPPAAPTASWSWRDVGIVVGASLAMLLPFLTKPVHMDDPLFVWCAQHLQSDPLDFYNYLINWYGHEELMYQVTQNPPLACYWLAAAGALFGFREAVLHGAMLVPAVLAAIGAYGLAARMCARPLLATLIGIITPAFWVSSTTLMCDVLMLALWTWAALAWLVACDERRPALFYVAALLIAAAALTKYYAVCLVPLLLAYSLARARLVPRAAGGRRPEPPAPLPWLHVGLALALAVAPLVAFDVITHWWYGSALLSRAMFYASSKSAQDREPLRQTLLGLCMLGGCLVGVLGYLHLLWSRWVVAGIAAAIVLLTALLSAGSGLQEMLLPSAAGALDAPQVIDLKPNTLVLHFVVFLAAGVLIVALAVHEFWQDRSAAAALLALWLLGTYAFAGFVNWTTNARSVLPAAPVMGILIARQIERRAAPQRQRGAGQARSTLPAWQLYVPLVPAALVALGVAVADDLHARSARNMVTRLGTKYANPPILWYQGHWGFQYYMWDFPANPFDLRYTPLRTGDRVIIPSNNTNPYADPAFIRLLELVDTQDDDYCPWASTMHGRVSGFYSSAWGPLPYCFGDVGPEHYWVYRYPGARTLVIQPKTTADQRLPPDSPALRKHQRLHDGKPVISRSGAAPS
ncbi:MAG: glycosyltransferase family 39 protein [Pirellulales bacterium]|nr:glycosyltransferase family 39 protein [Pirellulales bacterium]